MGNEECKAILSWETTTEFNVKSIELLQSADGIRFNQQAVVIPKGSNSHYEIEIDSYGNDYFKLKINDFDGNHEYSKQ